MTTLGLGAPNDQLRPGELARMLALGIRTFLIYLWDPGNRDHVAYWHWIAFRIRERYPDARIHVRIERRGDLGDPAGATRQLADIIAYRPQNILPSWGELAASYRICNEPNIESPQLTPAQWAAWQVAFAHHVRMVCPDGTRLYVPAISPSNQPSGTFDQWVDAAIDAATDGGFDGVDVHCYGPPAMQRGILIRYRGRWPGPLLVTESNPGAGNVFSHEQWAADLPATLDAAMSVGAEALILFIARWHRPDVVLPTTVDVLGSEPMETAIRALAQTTPTQSQRNPDAILTQLGEQMDTLNKNELIEYARWAQARLQNNEDPRDVTAFVEHLKRLGADWKQPTRYGLPYVEVRPLAETR